MAKSNNKDVEIQQPDDEGLALIRAGNDLTIASKAVIAAGPASQEQHAARKFFQAEGQRCYLKAYRLMAPATPMATPTATPPAAA